MPLLLSAALTWEKNQLESDHVLSMLVQLDIQDQPVPYRFANYEEDVLFHGLPFLKSSFRVDEMEDASSQSLARRRITVENVSREMQALAELYWPGGLIFTLTTWFPVDMKQPHETPFGTGDVFLVAQMTTDLRDAVIELIPEGITFTGTIPKRRYTTSSGYAHIPRRAG